MVEHGHIKFALRLLGQGASLTPSIGERLGLEHVLMVPKILHSLVEVQNLPAIMWLMARSNWLAQVVLAKDEKGRTPRARRGGSTRHISKFIFPYDGYITVYLYVNYLW